MSTHAETYEDLVKRENATRQRAAASPHRQPEPPAVMPVRERIPHAEALALGRSVLAPIMPLLALDSDAKPRAAWAGSLRRRCEFVNDLDCVMLPKSPADKMQIQRYLYNIAKRQICRGDVKMSVLIPDMAGALVQLDVWFARDHESDGVLDLFAAALPGNFGSILLYATGSAAHNVRIAEAAKAKGWHWHQFAGLQIPATAPGLPDKVVSQTEEMIYEALGMEFIKPWERV